MFYTAKSKLNIFNYTAESILRGANSTAKSDQAEWISLKLSSTIDNAKSI
jgi:hypothetical protein